MDFSIGTELGNFISDRLCYVFGAPFFAAASVADKQMAAGLFQIPRSHGKLSPFVGIDRNFDAQRFLIVIITI
jgi:hypothetical protein